MRGIHCAKLHMTLEVPFDYDPIGSGDRLHGWRILGKTTVSDQSTRRKIIDAMNETLEKKGGGAICFYPRHAVRWMNAGKQIDWLICFECGNVELYRESNRIGGYGTGAKKVQSIFDEILTKADIPLAMKKKKE